MKIRSLKLRGKLAGTSFALAVLDFIVDAIYLILLRICELPVLIRIATL